MSAGKTKVELIQAASIFKGADQKAIEHLASAVDEVSVDPGRTLITQGRHHAEGYVVASGTAEVEVDGEVVAEIGEGEMIGELSLLDGGAASATVKSKTAMSLLVVPHNRFDAMLDDNPAMARALAKDLAERLRAMDARAH